MTDVIPDQIIEETKDILDNNVDDPNPQRDPNKSFVRTIPIEFSLAEYPRIHLQDIGGSHEGFALGNNHRQSPEHQFQISVFHGIDQGYKFDVDGDGKVESQKRVLGTVTKDVIDEVNSNNSTYRNLNNNDNIFNVRTVDDQFFPANRTEGPVIKNVITCGIFLKR